MIVYLRKGERSKRRKTKKERKGRGKRAAGERMKRTLRGMKWGKEEEEKRGEEERRGRAGDHQWKVCVCPFFR
jgi:hypothetical protein